MCDRIPARRQLIVNTTSASGGSVPALERPGRAVIAATKSGTEKNATVFARYWVEALQDPAADTDKSDSISAMEAFSLRGEEDGGVLRLAEAAGHRTSRSSTIQVAANRCAKPATDKGQLMSSLTVLRLGGSSAGEQRSGQARPAREEGGTGTEDRHAEISESRDGSRGLQEATDSRAGGTGQGAGGAGQMRRALILVAAVRCCSVAVRAAAPADCWTLRKHGHRAEAQACFRGADAQQRCLHARRRLLGPGAVGARPTSSFAWPRRPANSKPLYKVRWGMLLHERFNDTDAADLFREALARIRRTPRPTSGLAMVSAESFDGKASEYALKAIAARSQAGRSP